MKYGLLALLFTAISIPVVADYEKGYELFKQKRYEDALVFLEEAINTRPDWYFPILLAGQCQYQMKNYEAALRNFDDVLTLEVPSDQIPLVKYQIARTYMAMRDWDKAIAQFTEVMSLVPDRKKFEILVNRGQCEVQAAKTAGNDQKALPYFRRAVKTFGEALALNVNHPLKEEAAFQKAYSQYKASELGGGSTGAMRAGIGAFQDVLEMNPKEKRAHQYIISLRFQLVRSLRGSQRETEYANAADDIAKYLQYWPNDTEFRYKRGLALQGATKYKEAIPVLKTVSQERADDHEVWFALASCQMAIKQFDAAIRNFQKAINNGGQNNPNAYSFTAYCYREQKAGCYHTDIPLYKNAISALEKGLKINSGNSTLKEDLERNRNNLSTLQQNLATENANHKATLENIASLKKTIELNLAKLQVNVDRNISQPTEELAQAIASGREVIQEDRAALAKEYTQLEKYAKEAAKCEGSDYDYLAEMRRVLNERES